MKIMTLFLVLFLPIVMSAQKIERDEKDSFTGSRIIQTKWEPITPISGMRGWFRFSAIDTILIFDYKRMTSDYLYIQENDKLMLKFDNNEVVELYSLDSYTACKGCGTVGYMGSGIVGVNPMYIIDEDIKEKLLSNLIIGIRMYTSEGYFENEIKPDKAKMVQDCMKLIATHK